MFWSEVDGALLRESAKLAGPVRESIEAQVNIAQIIEQWNLSYPKGSEVTKAEAKAWAKVHIKVDNNELNKGLGILYAIGWIFGRDVATSAYAHARLNKAAPTDEALRSLLNIDWSKWTPGNNPGALLASPPGGLKSLLQRRGLDLQGLTNTLLNRIGTHLADALMSGASDTMLGKMLETVVGDPERALTIANTSMASAMSVSTRETYQEFGVAKMRWLALEPCSTCSGNGAMGPVTPGEAVFKNVQGDNITEPPAHPNCRCALAPVIDLDQFKFVNQPRDDHGRWTSGGFVAGKWEKVDRVAQVDAAVEKYRTGTVNADGSPLSKEDVAVYRQSTEAYYNKTDQYNNGNVIVTIPSEFDIEKGQTTKTADILKTVDELQTARPLTGKVELKMDNQYLMDLSGKSTLGFRQDLLSGEGSMIQINVAANERASGLMRQKQTFGTPMPSQTADNMLEFTMAHEWGHAWDAQANRSLSKSVQKILDKNPDLLGTVSSYGKSSSNEAYAELFAQNYMEEKANIPKMPVTAKTESHLK
jgi:hypothetical protein